ncbi:MAG: biopolymer transporter ExbD [Bdellovibrionales bacterium RBG_16_40_8]|nr:MAG: biopolymer transporter ExbD [Bdellovibrionales bacterium RBG_16_40_8]
MASKLAGDHDEPMAEINIVPFVDIILVVLIIFMITTPFIVKPSININLPKAASGQDTTPSQLTITITADGRSLLNGKDATDDDISSFAKGAVADKPETQAIISADKDVPHGRVITIIDLVKSAGISKFAITIDKKK